MFNTNLAYISGMLIPVIYILLYLLGGAKRDNYSHISHSVSELLAPGAPNKHLLLPIQIIYALLHIVFGYGVLIFSMAVGSSHILGQLGAWCIIALGVTTFGTVIFPQDREGTPVTRAGQLHKILVFGGLIPLSILSTILLGIWSRQTGIFPGFDWYSYITVGLILTMGSIAGITIKSSYVGLVERIAALVSQQWLFVLGCVLVFHV